MVLLYITSLLTTGGLGYILEEYMQCKCRKEQTSTPLYYLIPTFDITYPQFNRNYELDSFAVMVQWLWRLHTSLFSFGVHGQVRMPLWSWLEPTCCWAVRSCRKLFQLSVTQKCWCASWRSVPRHPCRHYAWPRRTEVSECLSAVCDSVSTCRSSWSQKVFSLYFFNEMKTDKNDNNCSYVI